MLLKNCGLFFCTYRHAKDTLALKRKTAADKRIISVYIWLVYKTCYIQIFSGIRIAHPCGIIAKDYFVVLVCDKDGYLRQFWNTVKCSPHQGSSFIFIICLLNTAASSSALSLSAMSCSLSKERSALRLYLEK